jgi:hypothetical protein
MKENQSQINYAFVSCPLSEKCKMRKDGECVGNTASNSNCRHCNGKLIDYFVMDGGELWHKKCVCNTCPKSKSVFVDFNRDYIAEIDVGVKGKCHKRGSEEYNEFTHIKLR